MRYPDARYHGETGEATATYRSSDQSPDIVYPNGTKWSYLATGGLTRGLFGLYRLESPPRAGGPEPHFHRSFTESFYLVAGSLEVYDGRSWIAAKPGDFVHVPEGGIHGFRNVSDDWATLLIHFAPGAPREAYFEGNARFAREGKLSDEEMAAFYREHDNQFLD